MSDQDAAERFRTFVSVFFCRTVRVAGIDERVLLGGSLAYETGHFWQAAIQM